MSESMPKNSERLQNPYPEGNVDLKHLLMVMWGGKRLISAVTSLAAAASLLVALSLPNIFTASTLLALKESSGGSLSGLVQQYGGLQVWRECRFRAQMQGPTHSLVYSS